jgi:hypothetical protein
MKITKRQLRRIIREEKSKVLSERKVRRFVRRKLLEQTGIHTVTGNHEGQEFNVQVPDDLARTIVDAHAALLATVEDDGYGEPDITEADYGPEAQAFEQAARAVYEFVDEEVGKQTGKPVHPSYGINGEYHADGSQMSNILGDAMDYV